MCRSPRGALDLRTPVRYSLGMLEHRTITVFHTDGTVSVHGPMPALEAESLAEVLLAAPPVVRIIVSEPS